MPYQYLLNKRFPFQMIRFLEFGQGLNKAEKPSTAPKLESLAKWMILCSEKNYLHFYIANSKLLRQTLFKLG